MEITQYVKDKRNQKVGLLFATCDDKKVKIGFSKCDTRYDEFDRDLAIEIAKNRAIKNSEILYHKYNIPFLVDDLMVEFIDRCRRYYKDKEFPDWVRQFDNLYLAHEGY